MLFLTHPCVVWRLSFLFFLAHGEKHGSRQKTRLQQRAEPSNILSLLGGCVQSPGKQLVSTNVTLFELAAACRKSSLGLRRICSSLCAYAANATFFDSRPITFTHIPKTAGTSFKRQMKPYKEGQNCYAHMRHVCSFCSSVVFFRSPTAHVRSQFGECSWDVWGHRLTNGTRFPRTGDHEADFAAWIHHFSLLPDGPADDFNCIDPREVQTRHMSCINEPNPRANHALTYPPDLNKAINNLHDADFIGISDFYHESICLLVFRRTRMLPATCTCDSVTTHTVEIHETHGVPTTWSSSPVASMDALRRLVNYTVLDAQLFSAAMHRFRVDIAMAERISGKGILCDKHVANADALQRLYGD